METIVQQDFYDKGLHEIHDDVHFIVGAVRLLETQEIHEILVPEYAKETVFEALDYYGLEYRVDFGYPEKVICFIK